MYTVDIVKAVVNLQHGWAVADQFEDTFNNPTPLKFAEQNENALDYVKQTVEELLDSDLFSEDTEDELRGYLVAMDDAHKYWENSGDDEMDIMNNNPANDE